ncbi:lysophospholipid acyltransferase family protein [Polynucleobacter necessarius]|uniref:lysophospholipid acyltransferase family protein n=1 Tax=Polynucleobacter necessarius TaxID=576610 RepID=UPI001E541C92|nr:lysophospholipid acyltransferase family protein [Polynucleobacter necessarius]
MDKAQITQKQTPVLIKMGLWLLILLHILYGLWLLLLIFPHIDINKKHLYIQKWSKRLLLIFGIELLVVNHSVLKDKPYLLAANHISWIDIHAVNASNPIRFVAKSEVLSWPIFGWMAMQLGTVFINRASSRHAQQVVNGMSEVLKTESICIFPEGTASTLGGAVHPFKPNLFEAAVIAHMPVYSLAIRYISKETGKRSEVAAFVGDMGLLESMGNILKHRNLIVQLTFLPSAASGSNHPSDRKWLAVHSQAQVSKILLNTL